MPEKMVAFERIDCYGKFLGFILINPCHVVSIRRTSDTLEEVPVARSRVIMDAITVPDHNYEEQLIVKGSPSTICRNLGFEMVVADNVNVGDPHA